VARACAGQRGRRRLRSARRWMLLRVGPRWVLPARPVGTPEPYRVNPRSSGQPALRDRRPSLSSPLPAESQTVRSGTDFVLGTSVRANEAGLSIWSNGDCESNQTDRNRVPSGDHLTRSFFWDIGCDSKSRKQDAGAGGVRGHCYTSMSMSSPPNSSTSSSKSSDSTSSVLV
jgi:hypothetical protein